jgi:cyclophilin family peptidyl-prolyl cis-trans isomerase
MKATITTNKGVMVAELYDETPITTANFVKLAKEGEIFVTLDGVERTLSTSNMMITKIIFKNKFYVNLSSGKIQIFQYFQKFYSLTRYFNDF